MSYNTRVKKPKTNKGIGWYSRWKHLPVYKLPYLTKGYSNTVDPETGKFIGWPEYGYKEKGLKHRHRAYGKKMIKEALIDKLEDKKHQR